MYKLVFFDYVTYIAIANNLRIIEIPDMDTEHFTLTVTSRQAVYLAEMYVQQWGRTMIVINCFPQQ